MADVTISARISDDLHKELNSVASMMNRSKSWVVEEALREYVQREKAFLDAVQEGIDDIEKGNLVSHEEAVAQLNKIFEKKSD